MIRTLGELLENLCRAEASFFICDAARMWEERRLITEPAVRYVASERQESPKLSAPARLMDGRF